MSQIAIYRIVKKKWANTAFDGEGARRFGGRWNSKGKACVYFADSESLALLEILAHLESDAVLNAYCVIKSTINANQVMTLNTLPENWRDEPAPPQTAMIGDQWLNSHQSLALKVPSVIVPRQFNFIINPSHPKMADIIKNAQTISLDLDPRLL